MVYQNATAAPREELSDYVMESVTGNGMFIGAELLPPAPLRLPTGHYPKITIATGDLMRAAQTVRAPGSGFVRTQNTVSDGTLSLLQYAEELQIPDEQSMLYEDYFSLEQVNATEGRNKLLRLNEILCETALFNSTTFTATNSTVAYTTGNSATLSLIADLIAAIRRIRAAGEVPNTIVIPGVVWDVVRLGTLVQAFIAGANQPGAVVSDSTLQVAFLPYGIKKVYIADAYVNQSIDNDNTIINPIWPKTYIWVGNVQSGKLQGGGVGRTFFWEKEGPFMNVSSYRDEPKKSNIVRVMSTIQAAITNARAGQLITTQA